MTAVIQQCALADLDVPDESVDLVLTDPPYPREFLPTWTDLAALAARVLRPGGSLVAMSGQIYLDDVMRRLDHPDLTYRWTIACMTPGANGRIWPRKIYAGWKPILWYSKGTPAAPRRWIEDRIVSTPDKRFHKWGQSFGVFEDLVIAFSRSRDMVCDPFLGGGTTAAAAALLGRDFVGCDVDADALVKTQSRLDAVADYLRVEGTYV